jgi:hypothetical protein
VTLVCDDGALGPFVLATPGAPFRPGTDDTFRFRGDDLGPVFRLVVRNECEGRSDGWLLELAVVTKKHPDGRTETFKFPCDLWFR